MLKNVADRVLAAVGLLIAGAPMLVLAALVRWRLGHPVLFRQIRIGYRGKRFKLLKFRTMSDDCDTRGVLLPDEQRLRDFGLFLRSTSLDELPQLWNVLMGDMSLVGPRPLLPEYWPLYSDTERRRHEVKPGITGWAQVNGRNAVDWKTRFELDVWYVDHHSFSVDCQILLRTIFATLGKKGIVQPGHATMPKFTGSAAPGPER